MLFVRVRNVRVCNRTRIVSLYQNTNSSTITIHIVIYLSNSNSQLHTV